MIDKSQINNVQPEPQIVSDTQPIVIPSSPAIGNTLVVGSLVRFYDCYRANKDRNHSGDSHYYSVGKVVCRRITKRYYFIDNWLGGDDVVDIELSNGRISNGHFTDGVTVCL